jgi:hypothetical protein
MLFETDEPNPGTGGTMTHADEQALHETAAHGATAHGISA